MSGDEVTDLRLANLERSVSTLAEAAREQVEFNAAVRAWGRMGLLLYGTTQAIGLVLLAAVVAQLSK